jgi:hypothetical protein
MNRRSFTFGLGALLGAPKVPLGSVVSGASKAVPAAAFDHFSTAKIVARAHNNCSPEFLMRHLRVDKTMAKHVERILIDRNVITLPNLKGISKAVNPIQTHVFSHQIQKASITSDLASNSSNMTEKLPEKLAAHERHEPDESQAQAEDTIPASHGDAEEVPSDLVTTCDGGSQDLVE